MSKIESPKLITQFFGDDVELFSLNIIVALEFLLLQKKHEKIIKDILSITCPGVSIGKFMDIVKGYKAELENKIESSPYLLGKKIETSGKIIKKLNASPVRWLFLAFYWSWNLRDNSFEDIKYDNRIGNIVLLFLLKKNQMEQMELTGGLEAHPLKFYTDLGVRIVRIIEILTQMCLLDQTYLNRIYLSRNIQDIVENFLITIDSNRFESNTLSIVESEAGRALKYQNMHYLIELIIPSTRMLRDGYFSDIEDTRREWLQLMNLESKNTGMRNSNGGTRKSKERQIYDEIESALIPITMIDPSIINKEEEIERENRTLSSRIIYAKKLQNIPSQLNQYRQIKTFSSVVTKNNILLESDYDVPPIPILTQFSKKLKDTTRTDKFFKSLFLISICTGIKTEDIMSFLASEKQTAFKLKDTTLFARIETDFFAKKKKSALFVDTDETFSFELPTRLAMLIAEDRRIYKTVANEQFSLWFQSFSFSPSKPKNLCELQRSSIQFLTKKERLIANYIKYLQLLTKEYKYKIVIKPSKTYRYLLHYITSVGGDIRTGKLVTVTHSRNDRSRLAYTSSRKNATLHSQYVKDFWLKLDLDTTSDGLLSIPVDTYKTSISVLSNARYSGSALVVKPNESQKFFTTLLRNIKDCSSEKDRFNLISIYVRYAMSLLAGTREFSNSSDFTSWSKCQQILSINEKSSTWSMGVRYIPLNKTITSILTFYENILQERELPNNVFLFSNDEYSAYKAGNAVLIVEDMQNLMNKEIIQQYILEVPLNAGRHIFTQKALDMDIQYVHIDAFLGHYGKGEEQLGIYSCLQLRHFNEQIQAVTAAIETEHGVKELK